MKKIKVLRILFAESITHAELPLLRAAIALKAGKNNILFHHHINETDTLYRYPLVQYKCIDGCPAIICFNEGTDVIQEFLGNKDWKIKIGTRQTQLSIAHLYMKHFPLQVWNKHFTYRINNWIALNKKNYKAFLETPSLTERVRLLEKTLIAHILAFAEGVQWDVDKKIELFINNICKQRWIKYKNVGLMAFDVVFSVNISLPNYVGLGKASSVGFGTVNKLRKAESLQPQKESTEIEVHE